MSTRVCSHWRGPMSRRQDWASRIELTKCDIANFPAGGQFDLVWLPAPFLSKAIMPSALAAALRALSPTGHLIIGHCAGTGDTVSEALANSRAVRSGGHAWTSAEMVTSMTASGVADACEPQRTWTAPVRIFAGYAAAA